MKKSLLYILSLTTLLPALAQEFTNNDLQSLVNAERAFSLQAKEKNTRDAFLANLTDESVAFYPNTTKAKAFWEKAAAGTEWLYWQPVYADIAASGNFGYTTGPWSFRKDKSAEASAFGEYITVWKKQNDGNWKILIDAGINHSSYPVDGHSVKTSAIASQPSKKPEKDLVNELTAWEAAFIKEVPADGLKAFTHHVSKEIRFYRQGHLPLTAIEEACKVSDIITYTPIGTQVAPSGDMGFAYGSVTVVKHENGEQKTNTSNYLRIWKKENGTWKIVIDLIT
ncbi:MAG TPA: DUF4440 domain-containing protein [Ohtaekwangia sp.]|uniref:DUF4440 domain-containing protein n=1 Tax=Ohtaekwangia sp. TaxID=2066019 RepID=UPI002F92DAC1